MTLLATVSEMTDAVRVLSAVGDTFGGHGVGFCMRVASVAARFAVYRERDPESIAATFYAAALHRIGSVRQVVTRDAPLRDIEIAGWDDPPAGAAIVASTEAFPRATADAIRWHREAFDGTGFPDQLRWGSIPETAMTINIARAFVETLEAQGQNGAPWEATFALGAATGSRFSISTMRDFREFLAEEGTSCDEPYESTWPLQGIEPITLIARICAEIEARQVRTAGRGDRLERIVSDIVERLCDPHIDLGRAAFAARLTALGRTGRDGTADDIFTLSRLGLESRAAQAEAAARILATAPSFAAYAPIVGATEEWYDGSGLPGHQAGAAIDPIARVLAVAIAADALTARDAARRIAAAAGSRLDPDMVRAYLDTNVKQ